ncbi:MULTISPECIES: hypothetical protein [unclassified Streptomyces]|uniref:hypothetical protein n=1 Tax=unclassified Streptomyces TaxID=2593676 RepID=UPI00224F0EBE|nr:MULTISPECIES: hypothetical protein [unclassified Streptomyces]MCX5063889.1 hypothetical protein [Streptomyces sp. NBC_00452]
MARIAKGVAPAYKVSVASFCKNCSARPDGRNMAKLIAPLWLTYEPIPADFGKRFHLRQHRLLVRRNGVALELSAW